MCVRSVVRRPLRTAVRGSGRGAALLLLLAPLAGLSLVAQEPAADSAVAERCRGEEHRAFDFWIGRWEVRSEEGALLGRNHVRRVARGCALLESWRGATGGEGVSVNTFDADRGRWTQRWVGAGATLWLEGGLQQGRMVLTSPAPRPTPGGAVRDRITWTPLDDGRVQQVWEVSDDGGRSWTEIFRGLYSRVPDGP